MKVIFDSSFLMAVAEHPTTWYEDVVGGVGKFEPLLLDCVRRELEMLALGKGKRARAARVGLAMGSAFRTIPCRMTAVDDEIVSAAISNGAMVATMDAALMSTLRGAHVGVVSLRSGRVALV